MTNDSLEPSSRDQPPARVPDEFVVVRGGVAPLPPPGTRYSGAAGRDKDDAARGIPHGQMRATTAEEIRRRGCSVEYRPELTRGLVMNDRHVDIVEGEPGAFGEIEPNPVPKEARVR